MTATGIIFSNIHDSNLFELTHRRSVASVPFGCRYRLIDFALSNMVNSNIGDIKIITHYNYHSLMDHIGTGKDWDLARRSGGVKFLTPFITAYANNVNELYTTRLEALKSVNYSISCLTSDYVVLTDCNVICNINFGDMINDHISHNADITVAIKKMHVTPEMQGSASIISSDENGRMTDYQAHPSDFDGEADVNLNIMVINRRYLQEIVMDSIAHGYSSFSRDIFQRNLKHRNYRVYRYDGHFEGIDSFLDYFNTNMRLIKDKELYAELFETQNRPIYTKVRNSAPTYYGNHSFVRNSLIADGCIIEGSVENSILFRGVKVGRDTVVMNSILFQDTFTGENVTLQYVVTDKNVVVRDGVSISGHLTMPVYIDKGKML